jgi:hypothetical protein
MAFDSVWNNEQATYETITVEYVGNMETDGRLLLPLVLGLDSRTKGVIFVDLEGAGDIRPA